MTADAFVGRWHADDGFHTVIVARDARHLRVLVPGYPVQLHRLPLTEERYITALDYPLKRAARRLRNMAKNNSGGRVRRFLDTLLAKGVAP